MPKGLDIEQEIFKKSPKKAPDNIDSFIRSAPSKVQSKSSLGVEGGEKSGEKSYYEMIEHEELFYNYLSILAMIPQKHAEFLSILNTYGQRRNQNNSVIKENQQVFNPVT